MPATAAEDFDGDVTVYGGVGPVDPNDGDDSHRRRVRAATGSSTATPATTPSTSMPDGDRTDASVYGGTGNDSIDFEDDSGGDHLIVAGLGNDTVDYTGGRARSPSSAATRCSTRTTMPTRIHLGDFGRRTPASSRPWSTATAATTDRGGRSTSRRAARPRSTAAPATTTSRSTTTTSPAARTPRRWSTAARASTPSMSTSSGDATVFGGTGRVRSERRRGRHRRHRLGRLPRLRQRRRRRHLRSTAGRHVGARQSTSTVYGGAGDDDIFVDNASRTATSSSTAARTRTTSSSTTSGNATIFGGTGAVDPTDGDDTIDLDGDRRYRRGDEFLVYGNGGDDCIDAIIDDGDSITVVGGVGEDTIDVVGGTAMIVYGSPNDSPSSPGPNRGST